MENYFLLAVDAHAEHQRRRWVSPVQTQMILSAIEQGQLHIDLDLMNIQNNAFERSKIRTDQIVGVFENRSSSYDVEFFRQHTGARARVWVGSMMFDGTFGFVFDHTAIRSPEGDYRLIDPTQITKMLYEFDPKDGSTRAGVQLSSDASPSERSRFVLPPIVANEASLDVVDTFIEYLNYTKHDDAIISIALTGTKSTAVVGNTLALMLAHRYQGEKDRNPREHTDFTCRFANDIPSLPDDVMFGQDSSSPTHPRALLTVGLSVADARSIQRGEDRHGPVFVVTSTPTVNATQEGMATLNKRVAQWGVTFSLEPR